MNYQKIYHQIIERAATRQISGYSERHHIVPRCMGGCDNPTNLVALTAREHYIVHWLLWKIYRSSALAHAFFSMVRKGKGQERVVSARQYERAKQAMAAAKRGKNNYWYGTTGPMGGKTHSEDWKRAHRIRMKTASEYKRGRPVAEIPGLLAGEKTRFVEGQRPWNAGKTGRDSHMFGKPMSEDIKQKLRKPKPLVQCPYCDKVGGSSSTKRWHFENCKQRRDREE